MENKQKLTSHFYTLKKAKNFYVKVLDENLHSAELYFNLGNSYYKTGEINSITMYKYDKKDGLEVHYHINGNKKL